MKYYEYKLLRVIKDALQKMELEEQYEVCQLIHDYMQLNAALNNSSK